MSGPSAAMPVNPAAQPEQPTTRNAVGLIDSLTGPARTRLWIGYFGVILGMFMAILDIQIVASSISEIQAGLLAAPDEIAWVQSAYLIAEVIVMPMTGWLAQVFSTRWLFSVSCLGFTLASAGCAFAWNIESMIVFRALQGLFGGTMIPTLFSTSFVIFGGARSGIASLIPALVITFAPTMGPTLGGWLTSSLSWHWIFLVNLVPGLCVSLAVALCLNIDKPHFDQMRHFDFLGFLSIALFLGSLEYVLEEGAKKDWFQSDLILGLSILSVLAGVAFFRRVLTHPKPIVDIRVFANRDFTMGCLIVFALGFILYGSTFLIPLYCARVLHYDAFDIGSVMAITGLAQMAGGFGSNLLIRRFDARYILAFGLALTVAALYLNSELTALSGLGDMVLPQILRGLGYMLCAFPSNMIAMSNLPMSEIRGASGLFTLIRNMGGAIGLAVLNTQLIAREALHHARLSDAINDGRGTIAQTVEGLTAYLDDRYGGTVQSGLAAVKLLEAMTLRQAATLTFADMQLVMTVVSVLAVFCLFFVHPTPPNKAK
jgi:DHA2 family multidrug resistance protein